MATNNLYKIYVTSNNEWRELELDDLNLSTVFSIEEISDISQRKDNITKTITLKGTKQNNRVLGALYAIDRDVASDAVDPQNLMYNYKPNKYIDCFVLENNVEIIRGKLLVTSVDISEGVIYYNASIVGTVYSFFSLMSDRKLEELDSFNIPQFRGLVYNKTNIENSWNLPRLVGGMNIINRRELTSGGVVWTDGEISTTQAYAPYHSYTPFIKIIPNSDYVLRKSTNTESDKYIRLAFYDSGYSMINRFTSDAVETDFNVTSPANAVYVRLSFPTSVANIKMEEGLVFTGYSDNPEDRPKWFYPMIDYGGSMRGYEETTSFYPFRLDTLRPAIFTAEYLRAIFRGFRLNSDNKWSQLEDDGVTPLSLFRLESDLITQEWFKRLFIPHNDVKWTKKIFGTSDGGFPNVLYRANLTTPALTSANKDTQGLRIAHTNYTTGLASPYFSLVPKTTGGTRVNGKDVTAIRVKSPMKATIRITGNVVKTAGSGEAELFIAKLGVSGRDLTAENNLGDQSIDPRGSAGTSTINLVINNAEIDGDLYIGIRSSNDSINYTISGLQIRIVGEGGVDGTDVVVQYNDTFNLIDAIPKNVSIREFLKNIMLMFNLYLVVDRDDDTLLRLYTFDQFYDKVLNLDRSVALDWTKKIDWASYSINTNIDLPRGYTYKYKDDNDIMNVTYKRLWNETYGSMSVLDSSGLVDARTIELIFSPTINFRWKGSAELPVVYESDNLGDFTRKPMKSNLRILYYSGALDVTGSASGTFFVLDENGEFVYDNGVLVNFYKFPYSSMNLYTLKTVNGVIDKDDIIATLVFGLPAQSWSTDTLVFEDEELTLYKKHYESQIKELTDVNLVVVDAQAYLNEADINRLDFRIPIYLQSPYGSAYFKLLKVEYNDASTPATIRLQKIVLPDTNIKQSLK